MDELRGDWIRHLEEAIELVRAEVVMSACFAMQLPQNKKSDILLA